MLPGFGLALTHMYIYIDLCSEFVMHPFLRLLIHPLHRQCSPLSDPQPDDILSWVPERAFSRPGPCGL